MFECNSTHAKRLCNFIKTVFNIIHVPEMQANIVFHVTMMS